MLKAKSRFDIETNVVIGKTVFSFDKNGICEVPDVGYAGYDFNTLLQRPGVELYRELSEKPAEVVEIREENKEEGELKLDELETSSVQDQSSEAFNPTEARTDEYSALNFNKEVEIKETKSKKKK